MRQFVAQRIAHALQMRHRPILLLGGQQKLGLAERDHAVVLHRAEPKVGNRHHVDFGQRELDVEIVLKEGQHARRHRVQRLCHARHLGTRPHSDVGQRRTVEHTRHIGLCQIGHGESDQVGGHARRDSKVVADIIGTGNAVYMEGNGKEIKDEFCIILKEICTHVVLTLGILDIATVKFLWRTRLIRNRAFLSGRSKHGNALRASTGENWVLAIKLPGRNINLMTALLIQSTSNKFLLRLIVHRCVRGFVESVQSVAQSTDEAEPNQQAFVRR